MKIYKTIIVDDEMLAIDVITHHLNRFPNFEVVRTFTDSVEAFTFLRSGHQIDLVFTDIAMPKISGIELAKLALSDTKFVITTSFSQYAMESFDLDVIDYLLKPISFDRFTRAIGRFDRLMISANQKSAEPSFFVKDGDEFIKILIKDIDFIEGLKDYAKIVIGKNYCLVLKSLKSIEQVLAPHKFMRVHKSFIIPLAKVSQYNGKCVIIGNSEVPVGSSYRDGLTVDLNKNRL